MDNDGELGVGIKKSKTPRERHVEDELRPRRDRRGVSLEIQRGCQPPLKVPALARTVPLSEGNF